MNDLKHEPKQSNKSMKFPITEIKTTATSTTDDRRYPLDYQPKTKKPNQELSHHHRATSRRNP
jgi:hypothetical protein